MNFTLTNPNEIHGDQLVDEILIETGIDVSNRYSFCPPDKVKITGEDIEESAAAIQAVIDAHVPDPLYFPEDRERAEIKTAETNAVTEYATLPDWIKTLTAQEANDYINGEIWNGMTIDQIEDYIDANVTNIASAKVVLKQIAGAVLAIRGFFIITIKLLIYIRDLVIRFKKNIIK